MTYYMVRVIVKPSLYVHDGFIIGKGKIGALLLLEPDADDLIANNPGLEKIPARKLLLN